MILPDDSIDPMKIKSRLMTGDPLQPRPNGIMLVVWQSPLMCLTYSIICFLGGLSSVVISPLAKQPQWNDETKVRSWLSASLLCEGAFKTC
jgi:hypothetical protein